MKKITNLIIIDASGSMYRKEQEVKNGIKELLEDIENDMIENPKAKIKTIVAQFSSHGHYDVILNTSKLDEIDTSLAENYSANGGTALYDAIGESFSLVGKKQDGVFVNILTDGEENSSREFTAKAIKRMLKDAKKKKWAVTFMGTTESAIQNAVNLGVSRGNTYQYSDSIAGTKLSGSARLSGKAKYLTSVLTSTSSADIQADNLMEDE